MNGNGQTDSDAKVFVVDDDEAIRDLFRDLVESVGLRADVYPDAQSFLQSVDPEQPGCLVLDVLMPGMNGLELQNLMKERGFRLPVIMTSGHANVAMATQAMKAGAIDFVEKPAPSQNILDAIQRGLAADREWRQRSTERNDILTRMAQLSRREHQVLRMVASGMTSSAVAYELGLREKTVEAYRSQIKRKLGARNVVDAVRMLHAVEHPEPDSSHV